MSAFLQPWMLWGLGLASVPIVIHLLNRRRYQTVQWAAMDFLRAAFRKNQRRLRFENLLLLLVRTALIVFLVLALARPFLAGRVATALGGGAIHYTVLVDNSYSMGRNEGVTTPFERAVEEAVRIAGSLRAEDSFTLYLTNDNFAGAKPGIVRALFRDSHQAETVRAVLRRLTVSPGRSEMAQALAVVADQIDAKTSGKEVVVLTDLQRAAWEGAEAAGGTPTAGGDLSGLERTIRSLLEDLTTKGAVVHIVDTGAPDPDNVAVLDLAPVADRPLVEGNGEPFRARIANYGPRPVKVDVRFSVDGRQKGSVAVDVPGSRSIGDPSVGEARFTFPEIEAGARTFMAEIPADALTVDDSRLFVAEVRERIRVLAVDGDPLSERGPEVFYLKPAIALRSDRIEMEEVDPIAFDLRDLTGYDLVILANVERLREERVAALEEFVARGGGLVIFLGDKVDPELTNRNLGRDGKGLLPGILADLPTRIDPESPGVKISLDGARHPLYADVLGPEADPEGLWEKPSAHVYYRVTVPEDSPDVSVLLHMEDAGKSPALIEKTFGKGHVLLWTTSADMDWGDLPSTFVVPILWHEMVYYLAAGDSADLNILPFAAFVRELPARVLEVQVTTPNGGRVKVAPILTEGKAPRIEFRDTEVTGRYQVSASARGASAIDAATRRSTEVFAVNVDPREGDTRRLAAGEIAERYPTIPLQMGTTYAAARATGAARPEGEVWKGLLAIVLGLLYLEVFLARRFGDYARKLRREEARI